MQQLDLFDKSKEFYLHQKIEKLEGSIDRQRKAFFSMLAEMQNEIMNLKEKQA